MTKAYMFVVESDPELAKMYREVRDASKPNNAEEAHGMLALIVSLGDVPMFDANYPNLRFEVNEFVKWRFVDGRTNVDGLAVGWRRRPWSRPFGSPQERLCGRREPGESVGYE